jgi:hypothetical protein
MAIRKNYHGNSKDHGSIYLKIIIYRMQTSVAIKNIVFLQTLTFMYSAGGSRLSMYGNIHTPSILVLRA